MRIKTRKEDLLKPKDQKQEEVLTTLKELLQEIRKATELLNEIKQVLKAKRWVN